MVQRLWTQAQLTRPSKATLTEPFLSPADGKLHTTGKLERSTMGRRWLVLALTSFFMGCNYYCYDNPAALYRPLQNAYRNEPQFEVYYDLLYSVYSIPNIVLPLFGGLLVDKAGLYISLNLFSSLILVGQAVFATGCSLGSLPLMLVGRFLFGLGARTPRLASTRLAWPRLASPYLASFRLISPYLASSRLISPHLASPHLISSRPASPHLASSRLISPHLASSRLASSHLTSRLASLVHRWRIHLGRAVSPNRAMVRGWGARVCLRRSALHLPIRIGHQQRALALHRLRHVLGRCATLVGHSAVYPRAPLLRRGAVARCRRRSRPSCEPGPPCRAIAAAAAPLRARSYLDQCIARRGCRALGLI